MENVIIHASPLAYSVKLFCKAVGISVRHYYELKSRGDGPAETSLGGRVLIRADTAGRWLEKHEERDAA